MTDELEEHLTRVLRDQHWSPNEKLDHDKLDPARRAQAVRRAFRRRRAVRRTGTAAIGLLTLLGVGVGGWGLSARQHNPTAVQITSPTSPPTGPVPACRGSQLGVALLATTMVQNGKTMDGLFSFTNESATSCKLSGYPVFDAFTPYGRPIPLQITHGVDVATGATNAVTVILLGAGRPTDFVAQWQVAGTHCQLVTFLHIVPAGVADNVRTKAPFDFCAGASDVEPVVALSPVQPVGRSLIGMPLPVVSPPTTTTVTGFQPTGVSFINAQQGWVLGSSGCRSCADVEVTSDGGSTWTARPRPPATISFYSGGGVDDVYFADQKNGYLFGPDLYATHDGGDTWSRAALPAISEVTGEDGYAFALANNPNGGPSQLFRATVGSNTWSSVPLPRPTATCAACSEGFALYAQANTLLLLEGGSGSVGVTDAMLGALWTSNDNGAHWTSRPMPCTTGDGGAAIATIAYGHPDAWLVDCFDDEQSSQSQNTQHHVYGTANAGATWVRLADPSATGGPALLADNGSGHAVLTTEGDSDLLDATFDGAVHWSALFNDGGSFSGWADLQFVDTSTGFVVGPTDTASNHLYRTQNGGDTWQTVTLR